MLPNNNAIARFTYDWCIRFVRLVPSEEEQSKLSDVSPYFTELTHKYGFKWYEKLTIYDDTNIENKFPNNKEILANERLEFYHTQPMCILQMSKRKVYTPEIDLIACKFTPNELLYVVSNAKRTLFILSGVLTEPVYYASILPYLLNIGDITIDIDGLIYDDSLPKTVEHFNGKKRLQHLEFHNVKLDKNLTLKLIDSALKSLEFDISTYYYFVLFYTPSPPSDFFTPLVETIRKKFEAAALPDHFYAKRSPDNFSKIWMRISYDQIKLSEGRTFVNVPHQGWIQITGFDVPQRVWHDVS